MEGPLLSDNDHIVDTTIQGDSSSSIDGHNVRITIDGDSATTDKQTPYEAEGVQCCDPWTIVNVCLQFCLSLCEPDFAIVWNLFDFVVTLVQIAATIIVVIQGKNEHSEGPLYRWAIGYTWLCVSSLPILCWRFWQYSTSTVSSETSIRDRFKRMFDYFFVILVDYLVWHFIDNPSSRHDSTPYFWLCVAFLVSSFIRHVIPNFDCSFPFLFFPVIFRLEDLWDAFGPAIMFYFSCFVILGASITAICKCICKGECICD